MLQLFYALHTTPRTDSTSFLVAKERQLQTFGNRTNSPFTVWQDVIDSVLNDNHYTIRAPKRKEIEEWRHLDTGIAFYKRLFGNMRRGAIALVGNIDVQRLKPLILRYCGGLPTKFFPSKFRDVGGYPLSGVGGAILNKGADAQGYAVTAFTGFMQKWTLQADAEADALATILDTKLRETLRNDAGSVYACSAGIQLYQEPRARFVSSLYFPCEPNRVQALQEQALKLIREIKDGAITEQNLRDAKAKLLANREPTMKDNASWLGRIIFWTQLGYSPDKTLEYNDILASVTLQHLQEAAQRYFNESNIGTFILLPEPQKP
jgi:zinc protease